MAIGDYNYCENCIYGNREDARCRNCVDMEIHLEYNDDPDNEYSDNFVAYPIPLEELL